MYNKIISPGMYELLMVKEAEDQILGMLENIVGFKGTMQDRLQSSRAVEGKLSTRKHGVLKVMTGCKDFNREDRQLFSSVQEFGRRIKWEKSILPPLQNGQV
ncbi:hypothetical protein RRG08_009726 [Elysia crispata]|uniref:Uncharacterized protein n=1 Tax=Elysia crispata TaxID=231223 RepID=A0AAE0Y7X9_9GAST|nr:hypothetical protein RRG08_009726 [Elysia crispata]